MLFGTLKNKIAHKKLHAAVYRNERERRVISLKQARTVGIVYELWDKKTYDTIATLVKELQMQQMMVRTLGYIDKRTVPSYMPETMSFEFFTKKDVNWLGLPKGQSVNDFEKLDFDILLDFSSEDCFPVHYIVGLSKARFKIGKGEKNKLIYDLIMNFPANTNLTEEIGKIEHYLNKLKNE